MHSPCEASPDPIPLSSPPGGDGSFCPRARRRLVLIAAILASALGFIDGSVVSIAIPAIRSDIGASLADAQWISNAYALTLSALILVGGSAGDKFGLRRIFITGIILFIVASLVCAIAPDVSYLILARAAQGAGAAFMVPASLAIIAKAYPKDERGRAIGIWAASSALTTALGPVLGGFLLSAFDDSIWRAIFAINLPLGGAAILLLLKVPPDEATGQRKLDLVGAVLAIVAFGSLAYALTAPAAEADQPASGATAIFMIGGLIVLFGFIIWEAFQKAPMIDLSLFRIKAFSGANAATFFLYFALSGILFYLPMLLIAGWGLAEATVGVLFLPLSLAIAVLSGPVGHLSDRLGPRLPMTVGSMIVAAAFAGLAAVVDSGMHSFWFAVFPSMIVMGLGMALVVSPLSTAVMTSVEDEDTGAASGINNAISRVAGLIAVAAMGSLAAYRYTSMLGDKTASIPGFGEPSGELSPMLEAARLAASDAAFSAIAWVTAALCVLSAGLSWITQPASDKGAKVTTARE
ncbi:MFS transporter [Paracoccus onubensis]|uniref:DHA2 family efflux MFS transporter permease subunit n=1 Tax=Paracoccus onubensis TaxID=1675788 RepID=A0A418T1L9_9RHOB|nr:MFS transporter [Paracoccus onubensis]RJE87098.1 DHA2 family efflux MFS transporter permease subunit [Paracoccus onubensis]